MYAVGCASVDTARPRTPESCQHFKQTNDVAIGVHALTQTKEVKEVFRVNLLDSRLLPVFVIAENRSASSSFQIAKEDVFVFSEASGTSKTVIDQAAKELAYRNSAGKAAAGLIAGGGLGMAFSFLGMATEADIIQHDLAGRQFTSRTLDPGKRTEGFLFFRMPETTNTAQAFHVLARMKNAATGEVTPFDFPVNLNLSDK